ncbi:hypothetical protein LBMAG47_05740 [Planctomycetia bacterium]|nr:hypothetical protein LBMAG47_05740 [Planctomycetia bacterium]
MQRLVTAIVFGLCIGALRAEPVAEKKPPFAAEKIPGGLVIAAKPELAGVTKAWVWCAPDWAFGEAERGMTERFLEAGISVATGGGVYGGPVSQRSMNAFYAEMTPVDRLANLAQAKVPLFAVHGDMDTVVPLELNSGLLKDRYAALGGTMRVLVLPGQRHRMNVGFFRCKELVGLVKSRAAASKPAAQ